MTKHKHYYAIRAYADGWKIEYKNLQDGNWYLTQKPVFEEHKEYRVVPDENGWLPWYGGECQAEPDTMVEIWFYNCIARGRGKVSEYDWDSNQIIAYRILKEAKADPYAELKAAARDPTKQVRLRGSEIWVEGDFYVFDEPPENYEIRNKPLADPYAELKMAEADPNKEIAIRGHEATLGWHSGKYWQFDRPVEDYVVRDKPKKLKLYAYRYGGCKDIFYKTEETYFSNSWTREYDKDMEVGV